MFEVLETQNMYKLYGLLVVFLTTDPDFAM